MWQSYVTSSGGLNSHTSLFADTASSSIPQMFHAFLTTIRATYFHLVLASISLSTTGGFA